MGTPKRLKANRGADDKVVLAKLPSATAKPSAVFLADAAERSDGACKGESVAAEGLTWNSRGQRQQPDPARVRAQTRVAGIRSIRCQPRWACRPFRGRRSAPGELGNHLCRPLARGDSIILFGGVLSAAR